MFSPAAKRAKTMPKRFNLYNFIHKYARVQINNTVTLAGATDFANAQEKQRFLSVFNDLVIFLNDHGAREDTYIHPLLEEPESKLLEEVNQEHTQLNQQLKTLADRAPALTEENAAYNFYLDLGLFQSAYLLHLNSEERTLLPALHHHYDDAKLREVNQLMLTNMTREYVVEVTKGMLPTMNHAERCEMFSDMKASMPPPAFSGMCALAQEALSEEECTALFTAIDYTPSVRPSPP